MTAISPDLIASMTSSANSELLKALAEAMSPYALANGGEESIVEITTKLLHGTSLEDFLHNISFDKSFFDKDSFNNI